jgi:hypothetical protein
MQVALAQGVMKCVGIRVLICRMSEGEVMQLDSSGTQRLEECLSWVTILSRYVA